LILHPGVLPTADEAAQLCASLNTHFAADGLRFHAPHPQRWYLQLDDAPDMNTSPLAQVEGCNVYEHLPQGADALRWHSVFNEIQMLLHEHPVNQARETRGELPVNSVWLWGGGRDGGALKQAGVKMCSDSSLASAFAQVANIPNAALPDDAAQWLAGDEGGYLVVWEGLRRAFRRGDLLAWRDELQHFEQCCAKPLLNALRAGRIQRLTLDVVSTDVSRRFVLTRTAAWKLWRRPRPLAAYGPM
jgi:hypothetical protein